MAQMKKRAFIPVKAKMPWAWKAIIKKALIVGGTGVGLAIVANLVKPKTDEDEIDDNLEVTDLDEEIQEVNEEAQEEI